MESTPPGCIGVTTFAQVANRNSTAGFWVLSDPPGMRPGGVSRLPTFPQHAGALCRNRRNHTPEPCRRSTFALVGVVFCDPALQNVPSTVGLLL